MKNKKPDAALVWKQYEDLLAPRLHFSRTDRVVYSHLFRHSRLEGRAKFRFSIAWLARGVGLSMKAVRESVRSLVARGVLDLIERNCRTQHVIRLRLPLEVKAVLAKPAGPPEPTKAAINIEEEDFLLKQILRRSLHERERGNCFYCMRRTGERNWCLDHVVPQAKGGGNSYRNLVSCCAECNSSKGERSAEEYLRELYRERRLDARELSGRLRALDDLAVGKLKPALPA